MLSVLPARLNVCTSGFTSQLHPEHPDCVALSTLHLQNAELSSKCSETYTPFLAKHCPAESPDGDARGHSTRDLSSKVIVSRLGKPASPPELESHLRCTQSSGPVNGSRKDVNCSAKSAVWSLHGERIGTSLCQWADTDHAGFEKSGHEPWARTPQDKRVPRAAEWQGWSQPEGILPESDTFASASRCCIKAVVFWE
jgi:hypothetical protein